MAWYVNLLQLNNMYPNEIMKRREFIKFSIATSTIPLWYKNASAAESITMQAAWINDAEFAGYFIAIDEGFYLNEGLKVNYLSGGPDVIPESSIITGKADLALTTPDTTIKAIADQGAKFKIIGAAAAAANLLLELSIPEKKDDKLTNAKKGKVILVKSTAKLNLLLSSIKPGAIK